jgi:hypothetical protein
MTAFDRAFDLLKIGEPVDADWFMEEHSDVPGFDKLGQIMGANNIAEGWDDITQQAIIEQILHPSNIFGVTGAKTPTLYRAQRSTNPLWEKNRSDPWGEKRANQFRHGRFFSPQLVTAEQYSQYQGRHRDNPSPVYEFEMPVPLDHESVLRVPIRGRGLRIDFGSKYKPETIARFADANDMALEEAEDKLDSWEGVYSGWVPDSQKRFLDAATPFRNAGYDYLLWPEVASQVSFPPTAASAFGAIDWGARHEAEWDRREEVDKWWEPSRNILMEQLELPRRDAHSALGGHIGLPQWGLWHIGDEDSAPEFRQSLGVPDLRGKYERGGYPHYRTAADIAERALRSGL